MFVGWVDLAYFGLELGLSWLCAHQPYYQQGHYRQQQKSDMSSALIYLGVIGGTLTLWLLCAQALLPTWMRFLPLYKVLALPRELGL